MQTNVNVWLLLYQLCLNLHYDEELTSFMCARAWYSVAGIYAAHIKYMGFTSLCMDKQVTWLTTVPFVFCEWEGHWVATGQGNTVNRMSIYVLSRHLRLPCLQQILLAGKGGQKSLGY